MHHAGLAAARSGWPCAGWLASCWPGGSCLLLSWCRFGVLMWLEALGSHAAALPSGRFFALFADAVHAFTGLLWLGAVPALLVVFWRGPRAELVKSCRGPFSVLAAGSVLLVVVSGLYGAGRRGRHPSILVAAPYGRLLLLKTALLAAMGRAGTAERLAAAAPVCAARHDRSRGSVGAVLLVAVAALVGQAPPSSPHRPRSRRALTRSGFVPDLVVTVSATPNQPGVNWLTVLREQQSPAGTGAARRCRPADR